jgi:hypothetical protein
MKTSSRLLAVSFAALALALALPSRPAVAAPAEFIHIVGGSGVGKKTIIRRLLNPNEHALRARLRIGHSVAAYGYSFQNPPEAMLEAQTHQVIHQWQFRTDGLIDEAQRRFPNAHHRIVVLWRPVAEHTRDLRRRTPEWHSTEHSVRNEYENGVVPAVLRRERTGRYEVEWVDSSTDAMRRFH